MVDNRDSLCDSMRCCQLSLDFRLPGWFCGQFSWWTAALDMQEDSGRVLPQESRCDQHREIVYVKREEMPKWLRNLASE
jgi:hypothetical protein